MQFVEVKGRKVPALGFGTYGLDGDEAERMVRTALDIGYRHIDTARSYGNEAAVGRALRRSGVARDEIFLTTKVWHDSLAYEAVLSSVEASLRDLDTDRVDLLLVHWPNRAVPLAATLHAFEDLRDEGKVGAIGVSNFPVALLREAVEEIGADLLCDQVEYHPLLSQTPVLGYLRRHGMMLTAYSPLAQGRVANNPVLAEVGHRHGKSPAQAALRWLLDQPGVAAIPKSGSERRARENFEVFDFTLTDRDRREIDRLQGDGRLVNPGWAPDWDAS
ncbi:aldo/keto reductase [Arenibaculum sp.]|jgi:2,5-diketo-D-gluconate reductase B|uniref:aldo/keto reductase n=1 Tax=Arenibaculum sp. TaxID=2865862 RepID=UPI002E102560|nr:aldo/keto reductase [Arenibaculum sp.]